MVRRYSAYRRGSDTVAPDVVDRIYVGVCAAIWLVLIGTSVAAAVALVDLGRGFHKMDRSQHTTWVLYAVIIISALIIAGAIPVLLRARRTGQAEPITQSTGQGRGPQPVRSRSAVMNPPAGPARSPRVNVFSQTTDWSGEAVDRIWLRGTLALASVMGFALIAVAAATYFMAVRHDSASWVCYCLAGLVIAGMPMVEWLHVRRLRQEFATY